MAKATYSGIYCIEGVWPSRRETSARPVIELLGDYHEIPTVRRVAISVDQFKSRLREWSESDWCFSILYLWYHGSAGSISPSGGDDEVTLEDMGSILEGRCGNCLIHFGSCATLNLDPQEVARFFERTGAVAISGYVKNVGWIEPIALELLYLDCLQHMISSSGNQRYIDEKIMRLVSDRLEEGPFPELVKSSHFVLKLAEDIL